MTSSTAPPTAAEQALVSQILAQADPQKRDILDADAAVGIFMGSNLAPDILADIWHLSDEGIKGHLVRKDVAVAVRLIGWAQQGVKVTGELVHQSGPTAVISGLLPVSPNVFEKATSPFVDPTPSQNGETYFPPLSTETKAKYQTVFNQASPINGILAGYKVWQIFLKSKLPVEVLSEVWDLADTHNRGDLDCAEFIVAMYIFHGLFENRFSAVPKSLPSWVYEQAGGKPPFYRHDEGTTNAIGPSRSLASSRAFTIDFQSCRTTTNLEPLWPIPLSVLNIADRYLDILDDQKLGYVEGDVAVPFMLGSHLPEQDLSHVWDLADNPQTGQLDRDGLAMALFLIYRKLVGFDLPDTLPVPPMSTPISPIPVANTLGVPPKPDMHVRHSSMPDEKRLEIDELKRENRRLRAHSMKQPRTKELQMKLEALAQENATLRHSVSVSPSTSRRSVPAPIQEDSPPSEDDNIFDELWAQLREKNSTIAALKSSLKEKEEQSLGHTRQNLILHTEVENLQHQLQTMAADFEMVQRLASEDLTRETEGLRRQISELHEAANVPSSGDAELQTIINTELSRANSSLHTQVLELQESLTQLERASADFELQKEVERGLTKQNRRLQRQLDEAVQHHTAEGEELRRKIEELTVENQRLVHLQNIQAQAQAQAESAGSPRAAEVAPPAYAEVDG